MADEQLVVLLEARVRDFEKRMAAAEKRGTRTYARLNADSARATRAMERDMARATQRVNQALASTSSRVGAFGRSMAKGLAVGALAAGLAGVTRSIDGTIRAVATLGDEAARAGVNVERFQELKFIAEQNRIGVDQMVDGLKELNLRADEFIVTGKGPAAEAFARLGYGADELQRKLEDPADLMLEIIGRLEGMDRAAQIRIADEVFGGTAGERFVELVTRGEAALRATGQRAYEVGAVMDAEMVAKAQELDRKFAEVQARIGGMFKTLVVGVADFAASYDEGITARLDHTAQQIEALERAGMNLGEIIDLGEIDMGALEEAAGEAMETEAAYQALALQTDDLAASLRNAAFDLGAAGLTDAALEADRLGGELEALIGSWRRNQITTAEFGAELGNVTARAGEALRALDGINGVDLSGVVGKIGAVAAALQGVIQRAIAAAQAVASVPGGTYSGRGADPRQFGGSAKDWQNATASDLAPLRTDRPRPAPPLIDEMNLPPIGVGGGGGGGRSATGSRSGGGGGGGGAARLSELQQEIKSTREEIARLDAEAVELVALAGSGREVGDALEFARKKAELLLAAQESGRALTPELRAEMDALALSYVTAGQKAEEAAEKLQEMERRAEAGAEKMTDLFMGILDGSMSAEDALQGLVKELLRMQLMNIFKTLFAGGGAGGPLSFLGGMLANANGNAFDGGRLTAFARGGVVNGPTVFPMKNGAGLMGEAGPEAVMPLTRIGGKLGVRAEGGGKTEMQVNIHNHAGAEVEVRDQGGGRSDIFLRRAVIGAINHPEGRQALQSLLGGVRR